MPIFSHFGVKKNFIDRVLEIVKLFFLVKTENKYEKAIN